TWKTVSLGLLGPLTGPGLTNCSAQSYWDADLALSVLVDSTIYFFEGDVSFSGFCAGAGRVPNVMGTGSLSQPPTFQWEESTIGVPLPFFQLLGASTVPAGGMFLPSLNSVSCVGFDVLADVHVYDERVIVGVWAAWGCACERHASSSPAWIFPPNFRSD